MRRHRARARGAARARAPGDRASLRPPRRSAANARRGGAHLRRHTRTDPADREQHAQNARVATGSAAPEGHPLDLWRLACSRCVQTCHADVGCVFSTSSGSDMPVSPVAPGAIMDTLTISKQMADGLKRLASKRQKADTAATSAREDFLRAVEVARAEGATVEEIGRALSVSRERIHQLLG